MEGLRAEETQHEIPEEKHWSVLQHISTFNNKILVFISVLQWTQKSKI